MSDEETPSNKLAAITVDRLIASGLMRADKRDVLIAKVGTGSMSGADWKLEIDVASAKAAAE